jgi:hypothetical protein
MMCKTLESNKSLQGQCRVTVRRLTTARIYTACYVRTRCLPALMDSSLSRLNSLTTSAGLCYKQDLEEPVIPVLPSRHYCLRNRLVGAKLCDVSLLPPGPLVPLTLRSGAITLPLR